MKLLPFCKNLFYLAILKSNKTYKPVSDSPIPVNEILRFLLI